MDIPDDPREQLLFFVQRTLHNMVDLGKDRGFAREILTKLISWYVEDKEERGASIETAMQAWELINDRRTGGEH